MPGRLRVSGDLMAAVAVVKGAGAPVLFLRNRMTRGWNKRVLLPLQSGAWVRRLGGGRNQPGRSRPEYKYATPRVPGSNGSVFGGQLQTTLPPGWINIILSPRPLYVTLSF